MRQTRLPILLLALTAFVGCQDDGFDPPTNNRVNNGNNGTNNIIPAGKAIGADCLKVSAEKDCRALRQSAR